MDASGKPAGALTMTLLGVLGAKHDKLTWRDALSMIRHTLKINEYDQIPELAIGNQKLLDAFVDF